MAALMPDSIPQFIQMVQATPFASSVAIGGVSLSLFLLLKASTSTRKKGYCKLPRVPAVPGVPLLGNLLQLKEKKPHKTFARWADTYGPIYSIRTGASTVIVLNSTDVAKEAMVTRHSSISTRKLNNALTILTNDKCMVAMSDYNDFHKTVKRHILTNVLGPSAQKRHRCHRDVMLENILSRVHAHATYFSQSEALNFRDIFESELFGLALKEALGKDIESVYVEELGKTFTREDVFQVLVHEQMEGAIEVDWRDFFPYFKWIPNNSMETKIKGMAFRRNTLMKSIVKQHKSQIASGQELNSCYLNFLLSEAKTLTEDEIATLVWETIIEASDTNMVVTEWAMYELAKNPHQQDCLHREIRDVCGSEKLMEEDINKLPYLSAVFHETLRRHSPVPVIPLRYAHEDTQIAGYHIPAGSEIAINIYGCNMDKKQWESPEEWKPERFLDGKYDPMDLYKTMAFGGGKRVCAGSLQAMLIACTAIGKLVQEFEWRLNVGEYDSVDTHGLTGRKQDPLHLLVKPRN